MNKKILVGVTALLFGVTLTGCQVHFGRNAVTFGKVEPKKKKVAQKKVIKPKEAKKRVSNKTKIHKKIDKKPKKVKKVKSVNKWNLAKNRKLQAIVNNWSKKSGQQYVFYHKKVLKTKKGATYPLVFGKRKFILNKKSINIGYSPVGKNKYQYNVVAIANDDFKNWHNTYLFCLKKDKPIILLDQSKNTDPIMVKVVNDKVLNKEFKQLVDQK